MPSFSVSIDFITVAVAACLPCFQYSLFFFFLAVQSVFVNNQYLPFQLILYPVIPVLLFFYFLVRIACILVCIFLIFSQYFSLFFFIQYFSQYALLYFSKCISLYSSKYSLFFSISSQYSQYFC